MTRFDWLYLAASPVIVPYLIWRSAKTGKYRESAPAMLGRRLATEDHERWTGGCIWVHAVSVGEVNAARPMLGLFRKEWPALPILLTTVTETGQAAARRLVPDLAAASRYAPADLSWVVDRFLDVFRPRVLVILETELWPNTLLACRRRRIPVFVMNGKISPRSFRRYKRGAGLLRPALEAVTAYSVQTEADGARIRELAGTRAAVEVTGNCKFDIEPARLKAEDRTGLLTLLGVCEGTPLVVFGSTHEGEETMALAVANQLHKAEQAGCVVIVPRHPERFAKVWKQVKASSLSARRVSDGESAGEGSLRVVLLDRMGVLAHAYGVAAVAIVCGTLVPGIGGHNLLEPALHGVPVLFGPHVEKQPEMAGVLARVAGIAPVEPAALPARVLDLLRDDALRRETGQRALEAATANRGSAARNMEFMRARLPQGWTEA